MTDKDAEIAALCSQLAAVRGALEPFARAADKMIDEAPGALCVWGQQKLFKPGETCAVAHVYEFRAARQALSPSPGEGG